MIKRFFENPLDRPQSEVDEAKRAADESRIALAAANRPLRDGIPRPQVTHEPLIAAQRALADIEARLTTALQSETELVVARDTCNQELESAAGQLIESESSLKQYFPDSTWWRDRERRELAALWTDPE